MGAELEKQLKDQIQKQLQDAPAPQEEASINQQEEWDKVRENWAKQQVEKAQAHLDSFFETSDELPLSRHLLFVFIVAFFVIFVLWANWATLDEVTRGEGKIVPSSEVQALQTLEAGIVEEFMVREGDEVEAGQILMRLSDIDASSDLGANEARYLGLLASITRLQAEAEGAMTVEFPEEVMKGAPRSVTEEMNTFRANQQQLQNQLNVLQQQLAQRDQEVRELSTRVADTRSVIGLQQQEKDMVAPLVARGSAPELELLQLDRTIKEKNAELNSYQGNLGRARAAVDEAKARIEEARTAVQAQAQTELSAKLIEMSEIKERLSALTERKTRTELKSPVNGIIQELTVNTIGGVVSPGEDLIKIVPKDDVLIVEAKIRPSDRAFIHPGQKAVIKITAYDFSIYGGLDGELTYISQDTFEDEKGEVYYTVRLTTEKNHLIHNGEIKPITTGMVASVDILTGDKTVMQYLLKPFIKTLDKAMNER
ncbi:MAG: HlyD family type I secretion periplasmic adaptor subunit [Alphaproteobacteria bacterium]|nr:HlyD family type I secretion periplasmic adaptor subunit [Alphaproteobacteria bacterium]